MTPLAVDTAPATSGLCVHGGMAAKIPHLSSFFGGRAILKPGAPEVAAVLGWGARASGRSARREAERRGLPFLRIEDGFLRSVGLGGSGAPAVSLVADDAGIHYDASAPSRLEALVAAMPGQDERARAGLALWREQRLSKYNIGRDGGGGAGDLIILVDQVAGDASIAGAGAGAASFAAMLDAAQQSFETRRLRLRAHPDVVAGKARGHLAALAKRRGIKELDPELSTPAVLDSAAQVWTVSSQLGFEALLRGVPAIAFAAPFYAGYGLTQDRAKTPERRGDATLEALFAACLLHYARYADPVTRRALTFETAAARIADWRERRLQRNGRSTAAFGFSVWKRKAAAAFLGAPLAFAGRAAPQAARLLPASIKRVAVWGMTDRPGFAQAAQAGGRALVRVEDGFLRSVGLGSDLRLPGSLVVDDLGMYYDARSESRLERILRQSVFGAADLARAAALRRALVAQGVSKYNLAPAVADLRALAGGRRIALVAEQVPGDAAMRFGGGAVDGNWGLLCAARARLPGAFVVYKEHPDLIAGNRGGRIPARKLAGQADLTVERGDILGLFGMIDEMHVISSLAGFEALLRGVPVTAWGRPFYAGWGLTLDEMDFPRRGRRLALDELVAGALIAYPLYADPVCGVPCSAEDFLAALVHLRARGQSAPAFSLGQQAMRLGRWLRAAAGMG